MINKDDFILNNNASAREALRKLDKIGLSGSVLFIADNQNRIVGALTDGDIRRGLIKDSDIDDKVSVFMRKEFRYLDNVNKSKEKIKQFKLKSTRFIPLLDKNKKLLEILDLSKLHTILPVDAMIMAGGKGERLLPLTQNLPKPLLKVGNKPILEHNIDRLINFGISHITITLRHLGDKIVDYFGDGKSKGIEIKYVTENEPLGTIGSLKLVKDFAHDHILVMNSDLLTNIDFEDFYENFLNHNADMLVATIPYHVNIPYAVFELQKNTYISALKEKPRYTYYSNAGIYIMKKKLIKHIPLNRKFDATDMMNLVIKKKMKLISEPILGYWLDIGSMDDYRKALEDIKHISLL